MTVKEIAEAVNKTERAIRFWIQKVLTEKISARNQVLNDKMSLRNEALTGKMPVRNELTNDKMSLANSIREKAGHSSPEIPADYTLEETLLIIEAGLGKNAAGVFRANAANRNALTVQNDISARLDRIEKAITRLDYIENAIAQLALGQNQPRSRANQGSNRKLLENGHGKERCFYDFVEKNICISNHFWPIKRVKIWERYTETVKKADRMVQNVFFDNLEAIFPSMTIEKARVGPYFQFFCYGIYLKKNSYSSSSSS